MVSGKTSGRYHLYVSLACPWAHRTLIFRKLKNLENHIDVSVVSPDMLSNGWAFNEITGNHHDYYPENLRSMIDRVNGLVYDNINNGVYRAGFATVQGAYEEAYNAVFMALDSVEKILENNRYLVGPQITEADWRLFTTLIRFDAVYHGHFKCNRQRLEDFPNISNYVCELYQWSGVSESVDFYHIKRHYYYSHDMINPTRVVPAGPAIDFVREHNRTRLLASHAA